MKSVLMIAFMLAVVSTLARAALRAVFYPSCLKEDGKVI